MYAWNAKIIEKILCCCLSSKYQNDITNLAITVSQNSVDKITVSTTTSTTNKENKMTTKSSTDTIQNKQDNI